MISFIIVDYLSIEQTLKYLEECFEKLNPVEKADFLIVDNDASGKSREILESRYIVKHAELKEKTFAGRVFFFWFREKTIYYVIAGENLGYAKGNNLGAEISREIFRNPYYIFSNNDLHFPDGCSLDKLTAVFKNNKQIAVAGPCICNSRGDFQNPGTYSSAWEQLLVGNYRMLLPQFMQKKQQLGRMAESGGVCDWVSGSFFIADAEKFREVGGFDAGTFLYMEETMLSRRFEQLGCKAYYIPDIRVLHEHGSTVKSTIGELKGVKSSFASALYYYKTYRNLGTITEWFYRFSFNLFYGLFYIKKKLKALIKG